MLLSRPFDLLQVLIVTVFSEPGNDIAVRPVDLQCVTVLIIDVVLFKDNQESGIINTMVTSLTSIGI